MMKVSELADNVSWNIKIRKKITQKQTHFKNLF